MTDRIALPLHAVAFCPTVEKSGKERGNYFASLAYYVSV
jgi:hypothetical protein